VGEGNYVAVPLYDWSDDLGPDSLDDVAPLTGGVPVREIPNAERLSALIDEPGGFELWARELLGQHDALAGYRGIDELWFEWCDTLAADEPNRKDQRVIAARIVATIGVPRTALLLGLGASGLDRLLGRDPDLDDQIAELSELGLNGRQIAAATGKSRRTVVYRLKAARCANDPPTIGLEAA
jgi:hypothetical protein